MEKRLTREKEAIYRPAGRKQPLNRRLALLKSLNSHIKKAREGLEHYSRLLSSRKGVEKRLLELRQEKKKIVSVLDERRRVLDTWQDWMKLLDIRSRLSTMDRDQRLKGLSSTLYWNMEALEKEIQEKEERLEDIRKDLEQVRLRLEALAPDPRFLEKRDEISALEAAREKFIHLQQSRKDCLQEIFQLEQELNVVREGLGNHWNTELIRNTFFSVSERSSVLGFKKRMEAREKELERLSELMHIRNQDRRDLLGRLQVIQDRIHAKEGETMEIRQEAFSELRSRSERLFSAATELLEREREKRSLSQELECGMAQVFSVPDSRILDTVNAAGLVRQADAMAEVMSRLRKSREGVEKLLAALEEKKTGLTARIHRRRQRLRELRLPRELDGIPEDLLAKAVVLARPLTGFLARQAAVESELQRLNQELARCARKMDRLEKQQKALGRNLLPRITAGTGFVFILLSCLFFQKGRPEIMWAFVLAGIFLVSAYPFLKRHVSRKKAVTDDEIKQVHEQMEQLEISRERLSEAGKEFQRDRVELSEILDMKEVLEDRFLSRVLKVLEESSGILRKREMLVSEIQSIAQDLEILSERMELAGRELEAVREQERDANLRWKELVSSSHLSEGCRPSEIPLMARNITGLQGLAKDISRLQGEMELLFQEIQDHLDFFSGAGIRVGGLQDDGDASVLVEMAQGILLQVGNLEMVLQESRDLEKEHGHLETRLHALDEEINDIKKRIGEADQGRKTTVAAWNQWLEDKGLDRGAGPGEVLEMADLLERARKFLLRKDTREQDLENADSEMNRIAGRVSALFAQLKGGAEDSTDILSMIAVLTERLSGELDRDMKYRLLRQEYQGLKSEGHDLQEEITGLEAEMSRLLQAAGCSSTGEFRELFHVFSQRQELVQEQEVLSARLGLVAGTDDFEGISRTYASTSREELSREIRELSEALKRAESEMDELLQRRAEIGRELDDLVSSDQHMDLIAQRSSLLQEARELSEKWAVRCLALHILSKAKERFERENQPEVIRAASRYFSDITLGRYAGIMAAAGTSEIWAVDRAGERFGPERLSTGTAEQLYLSLRFGVMSACDTGGETLPVLMDDILVNFDPDRTRQSAAAIGRLAGERQVLFFTCHPHVVDILLEENPEAALIRLETPA